MNTIINCIIRYQWDCIPRSLTFFVTLGVVFDTWQVTRKYRDWYETKWEIIWCSVAGCLLTRRWFIYNTVASRLKRVSSKKNSLTKTIRFFLHILTNNIMEYKRTDGPIVAFFTLLDRHEIEVKARKNHKQVT